MGPHIQTLRLKILDKTNFKSNNYYLMAVIGRMNNLKVLKIHKDNMITLGVDGFKFMQKGFEKSQGSLLKLQINNILGMNSEDNLYGCLKSVPELRVLKLND